MIRRLGLPRCVLAAATLCVSPGFAEEGSDLLDDGAVGSHLDSAKEYLEADAPARAALEFEQVISYDNLPLTLYERADIYSAAVQDYQRGKRLSSFGYAEAGGGHYREENSRTTDNLGIDPTRSDYWRGRAGGGMGYILREDLSFDGTLDYRHVDYTDSDIRDDRDLRWRGALTRSLDSGSRTVGVRGRASYRGDDGYRQDYGVFANRNYALNARNRLLVEAELRRRDYPSGVEKERSHDIAEVWLRWTRTMLEDTAALELSVNGGREWETEGRPSGDQTFYGARLFWTHDLGNRMGYYLFALWEHSGSQEDIPFDDDEGTVRPITPDLDIYEFGGGLTWEFSPGWTLRPEFLYLRDEGNTPFSDYESIEAWMTVRLAF